MQIKRSKPDAEHTEALQKQLSDLQGPCIGCTDCNGICDVLFDTIVLPDLITSRKDRETE